MTTIASLSTLPDKTIVDELQVTVVEVFKAKDWQGKSVQDVKLADSTGQIKASLWEHPDATPLKGKEFILHSSRSGNGKYGGIQVRQDAKYGANLSVSKTGIFQHVEVYNQQSGKTPDTTQSPNGQSTGTPEKASGASANKPVNGQTVGMAVKVACDNLTLSGQPLAPKTIKIIASSIIKLAAELERGELDFGDEQQL